jgi:hypothetical protein
MLKEEKQRCFLKFLKELVGRLYGKVQLLIYALVQFVRETNYDEYF